MPVAKTHVLLDKAFKLCARVAPASKVDFERSLIALGWTPSEAERLVDYLPSACGRAFLREIGVVPSDTYQRPASDGSWGPSVLFSADPLWLDVEVFVETVRTNPARRRQFSAVAQLSAEVNEIDDAMHSGQSLADLAGSKFASVFAAPLKHPLPDDQ